MNQKLKFVLGRNKKKNIVGKEENGGQQHFLLFSQCLSKASSLGVVNSRDCVVKPLLQIRFITARV